MITLEVNGDRFRRFTEASVTYSRDTFGRAFRFLAVGTGGNPLPFKGGEPCEIVVEEYLIFFQFLLFYHLTFYHHYFVSNAKLFKYFEKSISFILAFFSVG